jgi:membrane dipeptidase
MKKFFVPVAALLLVLVPVFFGFVPQLVESTLNRVAVSTSRGVPPQARELHEALEIVDLHADSLLWGRDLLEKGSRGHADVPRLIEGNVALEVFTAVTKTPRGLNYERNEDNSDNIFWLALAQRWPPGTWNSMTQRALYLAKRFEPYRGFLQRQARSHPHSPGSRKLFEAAERESRDHRRAFGN